MSHNFLLVYPFVGFVGLSKNENLKLYQIVEPSLNPTPTAGNEKYFCPGITNEPNCAPCVLKQ